MSAVLAAPKTRSKNSTNVRPVRSAATALRAVRVGLRVAEVLPGDLAVAWSEWLFTSPRRFERPQREQVLLADARPFRFSAVAGASGAALHGWRWPARDGGEDRPAVLLVHGWEGRGAQLGALVEPLLARGFQVLTFDAPAHGDSPGQSVVLPELARAIVAAARVATAGGARLHAIVAHSMGAAATTIAIAHHDLLALGSPRLVYLAPPAWMSRATHKFARFMGISPEVRAGLDERLERRAGFSVFELDGPTLARRMRAPLLVVHDADDAEVPLADGRVLVDAWQGAELLVTSGLGHQRVLWAPEVVDKVSRFVE
jgi:pimeloyl-ACP methyl ester carboxylesterase